MVGTSDPFVVIDDQPPELTLSLDAVVYERSDGKRWTVSGTCDHRGDCLIGAVIAGFGLIASHDDIDAAKKQLGVDRLVSEIDVPVGPGDGAPGHSFSGCCPLVVTELP